MTKFQILCRTNKHGWATNGAEMAHNAEAAVKASYMKRPDPEILEMVAIPFRSWKPTPIRTETVTKVVLGDTQVGGGDTSEKPEVSPADAEAIG